LFRASIRGSLEGLFQSADKEKRGWLTIPEIRAEFKECSVPLPEEELQELCAELAHGEVIPYEAVLQRFQVHDLRPNVARALQRIKLELFRRKESLEDEFHRMDTRVGGYGALTMGELMSGLQRLGIRIGWMEFLELFRYADSDGNGVISLEVRSNSVHSCLFVRHWQRNATLLWRRRSSIGRFC